MQAVLLSSAVLLDNSDPNSYQLNISIRPEPLFSIGGFWVTNGMITTVIAVILCALLFGFLSRKKALIPGRGQALAEFAIESLLGQLEGSLGRRYGRTFFALIGTFFIFIIFANWFSLLPGIGTIGINKEKIVAATSGTVSSGNYAIVSGPATVQSQPNNSSSSAGTITDGTAAKVTNINGQWAQVTPLVAETTEVVNGAPSYEANTDEPSGYVLVSQLSPATQEKVLVPFFRAPNADINMTLSMALISVLLSEFMAIRVHGIGGWLKEFFPSLKLAWLGPIEIASHISRIISLTFRLYGNVFAGEVMIAVILSLGAGPILFVFIGLEVFFGFIQALVFFLLSTAYFTLGIVGQGETNEEEHGGSHPAIGEGGINQDLKYEERALQEAGVAH